MHRDSFITHHKTEGIQTDIEKHVETKFDTSIYELKRLLPRGQKLKKTFVQWNMNQMGK